MNKSIIRGISGFMLFVMLASFIQLPAGKVQAEDLELTAEQCYAYMKKIDSGYDFTLAIKSGGRVEAWGDNQYGQCDVPEDLDDVEAVSAGFGHSLALRSNGTVVAWGDNQYGQCDVPEGLDNVIAIAAGSSHSLVLRADGTAVAWGENQSGQCDFPEGLDDVTAIAAGGSHSLALKADGTVVAWGYEEACEVPEDLTDVVAIAAPWNHNLAVKSDGTVVAWGYDYSGVLDVPDGLGNVVGVSGSIYNSMALTSDGSVVVWSDANNSYFTSDIFQPPSDLTEVVAITSGQTGSSALKSDGSIVSWGCPKFASGCVDDANRYIDIYSYVGLYSNEDCTQGLTAENFELVLNSDGGDVTNAAISSVKSTNSTDEEEASPLKGGETAFRLFLDMTGSPKGVEWIQISPSNSHKLYEASGKTAGAHEPINKELNITELKFFSAVLSEDNRYLDITVNEAVYGDDKCTDPVRPSDFKLLFSRNDGNVTNVTIDSIKKDDSTDKYEASRLKGGEKNLRFFLNVGGTVGGEETIEVKPADGQSLFMVPGTAMKEDQTTGKIALNSDSLQLVSVRQVNNGYKTYIDMSFNRGVYGYVIPSQHYTKAVGINDILFTFNRNNGNALDALLDKVAKNNSAESFEASALTGGEKTLRFFITTRHAPSGVETVRLKATLFDLSENTMELDQTITLTAGFPQIISSKLANGNQYIDLSFNDRLYGKNSAPLAPSDFQLSFAANGGSASNVSIKSIKKNDSIDETKASPLMYGEQEVRIFLDITGTPSGEETIEIKPAGGQSIFNFFKDAMAESQTTRAINLITPFPPSWSTGDGTEPAGWMSDIMISAGNKHTLVMKNDGTVVAWGANKSGECNVPSGLYRVKAVAAGGGYTTDPFSLALKRDGTVVSWGNFALPQGLTGIKAIAAGDYSAFYLKYDGTVYASGIYDSNDQLDILPELNSVTSISAGMEHLLALKSDGTVAAWGSDYYGQSSVPAGLTDVKGVFAGGYYSLALKKDGTVVGWGDIRMPKEGLSDIVAISAGYDEYLVLLSDGRVRQYDCFENGWDVEIEGITAFSSGGSHSAAIKNNGDVVEWENKFYVDNGQLGMPQELNIYPFCMRGTIAADNSYVDIEFINASNGYPLYIYGPNGEPTPLSKSNLKVNIIKGSRSVLDVSISSLKKPDSTSEALASGLTGREETTVRAFLKVKGIADGTEIIEIRPATSFSVFSRTGDNFLSMQTTGPLALKVVPSQKNTLQSYRIDAGWGHSLGTKGKSGVVYAWGDNAFGQVTVPQDMINAAQVSSGYHHSTALLDDGTVKVWGENYYGQCSIPYGLNNIAQISAGGYHTLALNWSGTVTAWGDDFYGQCRIPLGLSKITQVSAGGHHSLALKSDGTVVAWGDNSFKQCEVPAGLNNIISVSAGEDHSLALKSDGTVVAWGDNSKGQCSVPANLGEVMAISAGYKHSLVLRTDGTLVAWGDNSKNQCNVPVELKDVVSISAGMNFSIALKEDGNVAAWGDSTAGRLDVPVGLMPPEIISTSLSSNDRYVDITFNKGVYGLSDGTGPIGAESFTLAFSSNSGTAAAAAIKSIKMNDSINEDSASALKGGETTVRVFLSMIGYPKGTETIELKLSDASMIFDSYGDAMYPGRTTGVITLFKQDPPLQVPGIQIDNVSDQLGAPYYEVILPDGTCLPGSYGHGVRTPILNLDTNFIDWEHTLKTGAGSNRIVLVGLYSSEPNPYHQRVLDVFFDGRKMTRAGIVASGDVKLDMYYMLDGDLPQNAGTYEILAKYNYPNHYLEGHAISLCNVAQQGPESISVATDSRNNYYPYYIGAKLTTKTDKAMVVNIAGVSRTNYLHANERAKGRTNQSGLGAYIMDTIGETFPNWDTTQGQWAEIAVAIRSAAYPVEPPAEEPPTPQEPEIKVGNSIAFEVKDLGFGAAPVQMGTKVAAVGDTQIRMTDDGETWGPAHDHPGGKVFSAGGKLWNFSFGNGIAVINSSSDGMNWTKQSCTIPVKVSGDGVGEFDYGNYAYIQGVASDGDSTLVAVGNALFSQGTKETFVKIWLTSYDNGATWSSNHIPEYWINTENTSVSVNSPRNFQRVIYFSYKFIAYDNQTMYYSIDGSKWEKALSFTKDSEDNLQDPVNHQITDIFARNNRLIAVGSGLDSDRINIYTSTDGVEWAPANITYIDPELEVEYPDTGRTYWNYGSYYDIGYAGNLFGVAGYSCIASSPDGVDWSLRAFDHKSWNLSVFHDKFYTYSRSGLLSSPDLVDWSLESLNGTDDILYTGGKAYAASPDGILVGYIPLEVDSISPADNAEGVSLNDSVTVSFTDDIKESANISDISIKKAGGAAVPFTMTTAGADKYIMLTPSSILEPLTKYTVEIPENALRDTADSRVNKLIKFSFTTGSDSTPPSITGSDPVNGAVDVPASSQIMIDFSRPITEGPGYHLIKTAPSDKPDSPISISKAISGSRFTITPVRPLTNMVNYSVSIPAGGIKDIYGNEAEAWSMQFTAGMDKLPPLIEGTEPVNYGERVSTGASIKVMFSEEMREGDGFGGITLQDIRSKEAIGIDANLSTTLTGSILKTTLTITPQKQLALHSTYSVTIPANAVKDMAGNHMELPYSFEFTEEIMNSYPVLLEVSPGEAEDNPGGPEINVDIRTGIVLLYDRPVAYTHKEDYSGIMLYDSIRHNPEEIEASVDPKQKNKIKIILEEPLSYSTDYELKIPANMVGDLYGHQDPVTRIYKFRTEPQRVVSTLPVPGGGNVPLNSCVAVVFDEDLSEGQMFKSTTLKKDDDTIVASRLMLDGNELLVAPLENLEAGTKYTVEVPRGAVYDADSNKNNYYTFSFTTGSGTEQVNDYEVSSGMEIGDALMEGDMVSFSADGCLAGAEDYFWDFGDGTSASGIEAGHAFAYRGNYDVILVVTGLGGERYAVHKVMNILKKPDPSSILLDVSPQTPVSLVAGGTADFTITLKCENKAIRNAPVNITRTYLLSEGKLPEPLATVTTDYNGNAVYRATLPEGVPEYYIAFKYGSREIRRILKNAAGKVEISGYVLDDRSAIQKNASVTVGVRSTITDADGFYKISDLNVGTYEMRVSSDVHYDDISNVVLAQKSTVRNILLAKIVPAGNPVIRTVLINNTPSGVGKNFYFLKGVDADIEISAMVDWKGHDPGYLEFKKGGKVYNEADMRLSLNAGKDIAPGEQITVTCVTESGARSETVNVRANVIASLPQEFPFELNPTYVEGKYIVDKYITLTGISTPSITKIPLISGGPVSFLTEPVHVTGVMSLDGTFHAFVGKSTNMSAYGFYSKNNILQKYLAKRSAVTEAEKNAISSRRSRSFLGTVDIGETVDASFYWYYEPSIRAWRYKDGSVHLIVDANAYAKGTYGIPIKYVPLGIYISGDFKVVLDTLINATYYNGKIDYSLGALDLKDLYIKIGGGIDAIIGSGGIFFSGDGKVKVEFPSKKTDYYINVKGGGEVKIAIWSWSATFLEYEWGDDSPWNKGSYGLKASVNDSRSSSKRRLIPESTDEFEIMGRDYLEEQSDWMPEDSINEGDEDYGRDKGKKLRSASLQAASEPGTDTKNTAEVTLKSNTFPYTDHNVIAYEDGAFMVFVQDDPSRSDLNRIRAEYSVYEGGIWSAPEPIDPDDSTADYEPVAARTDSGVIAAWENIREVLPPDSELKDSLAKEEISVGRYDTATKTWSDIYNLTSDSYLDYSPRIAASGNDGILVWTKSRSNDYSAILSKEYSAENDIMFSKWDGEAFSTPVEISSTEDLIVSSSLAYDGNKGFYVYALDEDNDTNTTEDQEIYMMTYSGGGWSGPEKLTVNSVRDANPQVCCVDGKGFVVWDQEGKIVYTADALSLQIEAALEETIIKDGYTIACEEDGTIALVGPGASDNGQDIYAVIYDSANNTWSSEIKLTSDNSFDRSPSSAFVGNRLITVYNRAKIINMTNSADGQSYPTIGSSADLKMVTLDLGHDLAVSADTITLSENNLFPGSLVTIEASIENKGTFTESGVEVGFYAGDPKAGGQIIGQTQVIHEDIAPGRTASARVQWEVPAAVTDGRIYVVVDPEDKRKDEGRSDNTALINIMQPDLELSGLECTPAGDGKYAVKAKVSNIGGADISNAAVSFYYGSGSSQLELIDSVDTGALKAGEKADVPFLWSPAAGTFKDAMASLLATADTPEGVAESALDNNVRMLTVNMAQLEVLSFEPDNSQVNVNVNKAVAISFNEAISQGDDYESIVMKGPGGTPVGAVKSISGETLTVTPNQPLQYETTYTLTLPKDGIVGAGGSRLSADFSITFSTEGSRAYPLIQTMSDIPIGSTITLPFSRNIGRGPDFGAISLKDSAGRAVACTLTYQNNLLRIKPDKALSFNSSYVLVIPEGGLKDSEGNSINACSLSFTTRKNSGLLKSLILSTGELKPEFDPDITSYTVDLTKHQSSIVISAAPEITTSAVTVNGTKISDGQSKTIELNQASTNITIVVRGEDAFECTYGIVVRNPSGQGSEGNEDNDRDDRNDISPVVNKPLQETAGIVTGAYMENIPVNTDRAKGITTVSLNESILDKAFGMAAAGMDGTRTISIEMPEIQGTNSYVLQLPAVELFSDNAGRKIEMISEAGTIILPGNMLKGTELEKTGNVGISIGKADKTGLTEELQAVLGSRPVVELKLIAGGKPVSWNNPNTPVTVSIPYVPTAEELADPEHITVWYIDGSGGLVPVTSGRYDNTTGLVTFTTTHFSKYAVAYLKKTFSDLGNALWAEKAVQVLASKGILEGVTEKEYSPGTNITRADFLYYLIKTLGADAEFDSNFEDVKEDAYYYREIGIAKKLGITAGSENNKFYPDEGITRQDMMVLAGRALGTLKKLKQQGTASDLARFADKSLIAAYASDHVASIVKEGLIVGSGDRINPLGNTTRAEAAVFLYRIYNRF
ncbi:MAG TPA: Ig-like domain-containing protein [Clostridia bacterium]|nr:Ig-like domain-containing protein [Clostridia bacterium]